MKRAPALLWLAFVIGSTLAIRAQEPNRRGILIFAAASLQNVLDELTPQLEQAAGASVRFSYAASSDLTRQIENGAPADIFISADIDWMNYASDHRLVKTDTRINLVGNALVLIGPAGNSTRIKIGPRFALRAALGAGRLAVADPAAVPAGKYARAALTALGVWSDVQDRLAPAENVRAALLLVSRGEAPLGIVYRTDAMADKGVVVVDTFPETTHPPIVYPAALTLTGSAPAQRALTFLRSAPAQAVFAKRGFDVGGGHDRR
jgi:molybdate transport system substrate-binding protein